MNHDPTTEALQRLANRTIRPRPLDPDAKRRIQQRIDEAYERDPATTEPSGPIDLAPIPDADSRTPRPGLRLALAAAVASVIVIGVTVLVGDGDDATNQIATRQPTSTPTYPPDHPGGLLAPGARWRLAGESPVGAGTMPSLVVRVDDPVDGGDVTATARVSTSDAPPLQYQGMVRFASHDDHVDPPMVVLDPQRGWVDCDATIDVTASGLATCGGDTVIYTSSPGTTDEIETPLGTYEARRVAIDWQLGAAAPMRTTVWTTNDGGPVRIEVDDGDITATYALTDVEIPPPTTTEPGG